MYKTELHHMLKHLEIVRMDNYLVSVDSIPSLGEYIIKTATPLARYTVITSTSTGKKHIEGVISNTTVYSEVVSYETNDTVSDFHRNVINRVPKTLGLLDELLLRDTINYLANLNLINVVGIQIHTNQKQSSIIIKFIDDAEYRITINMHGEHNRRYTYKILILDRYTTSTKTGVGRNCLKSLADVTNTLRSKKVGVAVQ